MILRTPTDQAATARGAHARRTRRAAARSRLYFRDVKLRREVNELCAEAGIDAPFDCVYFGMPTGKGGAGGAPAMMTEGEQKSVWKSLGRVARSWM